MHIKDLTALNILVFEAALSAHGKPLSSSAYERYYIASVHEHSRPEFMRILTNVLHKQGFIESSDVKHVSFEEAPQFNLYVHFEFEKCKALDILIYGIQSDGWKCAGSS